MNKLYKESEMNLVDREAKPYLTTKALKPENQETPIHFIDDFITPLKYFYLKSHFDYPVLNESMFKLSITGEVIKPRIFEYEEILKMPAKEYAAYLECAGNKRAFFNPKVYGVQSEEGAISQGLWKGVPLRTLLTQTGLKDTAKEIVFEGHDFGTRPNIEGVIRFARSLPIEKAMHQDTMIVYGLNGDYLTFKHGYPLRLFVPNWYSIASVKWLKSIKVIDHHFTGPLQDIDYNYYPNETNDIGKTPVDIVNVYSSIQQPIDYRVLEPGMHIIKGIAWTGMGQIETVDISTDGGTSWETAELKQRKDQPYSWTFWEYQWNALEKGEYIILSRAKDTNGRIQPNEAFWNRKGYGYNAIYKIHIKII